MGLSSQAKSKFIKAVYSATDRAFNGAQLDARAARCIRRRTVVSSLSVAFVKQASYVDLYTLPTDSEDGRRSAREIYGSSNFRSGPVGLLAHFDCDVIIVQCAEAPECKIWEYRLANESKGNPVTAERRLRRRREQEERAVEAASVDWAKYDLVICMENAVPSSIASQYLNTVWATMLEWFGMPEFKRYLFKPPAGYDVFLTQCFSAIPLDSMLPSSCLHWPYGFIHSSSFRKLGLLDGATKGDSLVLDRNAEAFRPRLEQESALVSRIEVLGGMNIKEFAARMASAKYYSSFATKRLLWGNGTLDTAALGALILTDRSKLINPSIVGAQCHVASAEELIAKVHEFDADHLKFQSALEEQRQRLDYFAFWRPLFELHSFAGKQARFENLTGKLDALFDQV
jgi:hypothetical protein